MRHFTEYLRAVLLGLADFAIVASYLSTTAKWGIDALDALTMLFTEGPWLRPRRHRKPGRKPRTAKPPPKANPASGPSRMPTASTNQAHSS